MPDSENPGAAFEAPDFDLDKLHYVYTPLPTPSSIRLVSLVTPSDGDTRILFLAMKVVDLNDRPVYDALSYTWGNPLSVFRTQDERASAETEGDETQMVICDNRVMHIKQNLFDFLHSWKQMLAAASDPDDERVKQALEANLMPPRELWIDAISINQNDKDEKNDQVSMMGRIYSATRKVNIWLGRDDPFARPALQLAMKMQRIGQMQARAVRHLDDEGAKKLGLPPASSSAWWSLFAFLNRAWFRRVWVMQELAFAPQVQVLCGSLTFTWETITTTCAVLYESRIGEAMDIWAWLELTGPGFDEPLFLEDLTPIVTPRERLDSDRHLFTTLSGVESAKSYRNVIRLESIRVGDGSRLGTVGKGFRLGTNSKELISNIPILHMFDDSREFEATDPRDKIYAILGIAERDAHDSENVSSFRRPICPNYHLKTEEVFVESAWYILLSGSDLDILMRTYLTELDKDTKQGLNLPSWVPDWTVSRGETPLWTLTPYRNSKWSASKDSNWVPPEEPRLHRKCLPVRGLLIDTLEEVVESGHFSLSYSGKIASKLPRAYPYTGDSLTPDEVLWRTLIANFDDNNYPAKSEFTQIFFDWWMDENRAISREYHTAEGMANKEKEDDYYRFVYHSQDLFPRQDELLVKYWARQNGEDKDLQSPASVTQASPKFASDKVGSGSDAKMNRLAALRPFTVEEGNKEAEAEQVQIEGPSLLPPGNNTEPPLSQVDKMTKAMFRHFEEPESPLEDEKTDDKHEGSNPIREDDKADDDTTSKPVKIRPSPSRLHNEFERLRNFSSRRRIFRSEKHYLGNGPICARPGDEIWLLEGGKVPFVLRLQDNGKYLLVGDAYVHGIMHGEAFDTQGKGFMNIELI